MLLFDLGILGADLLEDLVEEAVGHFENVVLGETGDLLPVVLQGVLEGVADNLLGSGPRDDFQRMHLVGAGLVLDAGVEVLFVFAHDHDVHRRVLGADERVIGDAGPNVGIESEGLSGGDVQALVTPALRRGNGSFEENFGAPERFPGVGLDT